jgi:phenylalanyl-tRNA synthetase beta chain
VQKGEVDIYPEPVQSPIIEVTAQYVAQRLGYELSEEELKNWLERLNCKVEKKGETLLVTPPTYRFDISIKEDLVEEFARVNGYDKIKERLPVLSTEPTRHNFDYEFSHKVSDILTGMGIQQGLNYAFIGEGQSEEIWGEKGKKLFGMSFSKDSVKLVNPISEELAVMRESLLPSLLKNLVYNDRRGNSVGKLFELSSTHQKTEEGFSEEKRLALVFWGQQEGLWKAKNKNEVVFELKSTMEALLRSIGGRNWRWDQLKMEDSPPGFHPSQSVGLFYEGQVIGVLGTMHPSIKDQYKLRQEVAWAEFNFEALSKRQPRSPKFKALAKYPAVERDIALVAPENVQASLMSSEIKKSAGPLLVHHEIFDIYQDKALKEAGQRSIAFRLRFQSAEETLKDKKVNEIRDKVVNSLCQKLGLEIR